jgi:uncharacterized protein (TIGR02466 family)
MNIEEIPLFASTIFSTELSVPENIVEKVHDLMKDQPSVEISNRGGWQSKSYGGQEIEWMVPIVEQLWKGVKHFVKLYGANPDMVNTCEYWFNVNRKGDFNQVHSHPKSMFSAVMYVKVPKTNNGGDIVFKNPTNDSYSFSSFFSSSPVEITDYNAPTYHFSPSDGRVFFFPSYLEHYVEPNESDEDRISIAFNFTY